jgi:hypothetical protein
LADDAGRGVVGRPGEDRDPRALEPALCEVKGLPTNLSLRSRDRDSSEVYGEPAFELDDSPAADLGDDQRVGGCRDRKE